MGVPVLSRRPRHAPGTTSPAVALAAILAVRRATPPAVVAALVAALAWATPASTAPLNTTVVTIPNPQPAADAAFGFAVVSTGDVNGDSVADFAVGAPGADRVVVYNGATRAVIRTITDPENQPGNDFGFALADVRDVNGDGVADLAVGARGVDNAIPLPCPIPPCNASPSQGRAFVFSGATGALIRKLTPADTEFNAFGFSLAGLGDVSGDGVPDIAVGAPTRLSNRFGQVYAFSGADGSVLWLGNEGTQALASFGHSLTAIADVNGDTRPDIITGSIFHDIDPGAGTTLVGRATVLSGATGAEIRHHDNPLGASGENFGFASAGLGDQTGDGVEDYAVSDPGAARVHLFNGATGATLGTLATAGSAGDNFGADVASTPDRSGDGRRDLWIGEPGAGKVHLLSASGGVLLTIADPAPSSAPSLLDFGFALAPTPDLGGDPGEDLLIGGSTTHDGATAGSGAAYLVLIAANRPPVADAGADATAECVGPAGTAVVLDGSASSDPDGDTLSYEWRDAANQVVGTSATVNVTLPVGSHTYALTVADGFGGTDSDTVTVVIADTTAPTVTLSLSPGALWPPNHKLVGVAATVTATDVCAGNLPAILASVTSSEPDNGTGDGDTAGDIAGAAVGTADLAFSLRAERSGGGPGRDYTVTYSATDPSGNSSTASATVTVPSSRR